MYRAAIAQRRLPFNISVVSDFMRARNRSWKQPFGEVPFAAIARTLQDEVCPKKRTTCNPWRPVSHVLRPRECSSGLQLICHCKVGKGALQGWLVLQTLRNGVMVVDSPRLADDIRRAKDFARFRPRSPPHYARRRSVSCCASCVCRADLSAGQECPAGTRLLHQITNLFPMSIALQVRLQRP